MNVMLADDISGGILALLIMAVSLAASLVALGALFPASKGRKLPTFCLVAPAFLAGSIVTCWMIYDYFKTPSPDADFQFGHDFFAPWIFLAGPALFTSCLGLLVLWARRKKMKQDANFTN